MPLYQTRKCKTKSNQKNCRQQNKSGRGIKIGDEKGKKVVGKGGDAGYQHFLLFPQWLFILMHSPFRPNFYA